MNTIQLEVQGMSCGGCVKSVTSALKPLLGISSVDVDLPTGHVTVNGDLPQGGDPLVQALTAAGFPTKLAASTIASTVIKKSGGCCG